MYFYSFNVILLCVKILVSFLLVKYVGYSLQRGCGIVFVDFVPELDFFFSFPLLLFE